MTGINRIAHHNHVYAPNAGGFLQSYGEVSRPPTEHPQSYVYPNGIPSFAGPPPTVSYPPANNFYAASNYGYPIPFNYPTAHPFPTMQNPYPVSYGHSVNNCCTLSISTSTVLKKEYVLLMFICIFE